MTPARRNRLEGNISLEEINLLRPEVIIAFNLLRNRHISLLCMQYRALISGFELLISIISKRIKL